MDSRPHLLGLVAGLFLAAGLVLSAMLFTRAWVKITESQTIAATGSARKSVRADLVVWHANFSFEANTLSAAQRGLDVDFAKVDTFLRSRGLSNFTVSTVGIQELRSTEKNVDGSAQQKVTSYRLTRSVEVRSPEVDRISGIERESGALVQEGVLFTTANLEFIYTKAGDAKVEMLAEATRDARTRAEQIASQGGRVVAQLRSAKMGVFQITPVFSIQTSWEGINDTTSLEKTIAAVISANFSMR